MARTDKTTGPAKRLATVKETCLYAKISRTKIYEFLSDGRIEGFKRDGQTLISLDSIDAMHAGLPRIAPKGAG